MVQPRVVFFDFGGTLVEQLVEPVDVWLECSCALGLDVDPASMTRALKTADAWFQSIVFDYDGRTDEMWKLYEGRVLELLGTSDPDRTEQIHGRFRGVTWNRAYPESREVLQTLRGRGYPLHVISNATDEVRGRLREEGLLDYFESITYSQGAGANKPDPRIFRLALSRANCGASEAVHIGNLYKDDVVGAR